MKRPKTNEKKAEKYLDETTPKLKSKVEKSVEPTNERERESFRISLVSPFFPPPEDLNTYRKMQ